MILEVSEENFELEVLNANQTVIVKLYTEHCSNCKKIAPIFEELASEYHSDYKFCDWNVIKKSSILSEYRVMAVPTFLFFRNGKLMNRRVGVLSKKRILKYLTKISLYDKQEVKMNELKGFMDWSFLKFWE